MLVEALGFIFIFVLISVLLAVAFFTLLEVRLLGLLHERFGPNKVGLAGYFQPFGDFIKLFKRGIWFPSASNLFFYFLSPLLRLLLGLAVWTIYLGDFSFLVLIWGSLLFFCLRSLVVYFFLFRGWSSGSLYSSLGSFRSAAQAVSYEVAMIFIFFSLIYFFSGFNFIDLIYYFINLHLLLLFFPLFLIWILSCLAESRRAPFDFSEGESELVSGFNTEYLGGFFAFIFIAEYGFILFLGFFTSLLFLGGGFLWLRGLFLVYFYILVRGAYPRLRFDELIMFIWKIILPVVIGCFMVGLSVSFLLFCRFNSFY